MKTANQNQATRGKWAEKQVKLQLDRLARYSNFAAYRLPDARAGSFQPTLADFLFLRDGGLTLLEVKQVDHAFRLPYRNFGQDQIARMMNFQAAGADCRVLVCHTPLVEAAAVSQRRKVAAWRLVSVSWLRDKWNPESGSWDLTDYTLEPLSELL